MMRGIGAALLVLGAQVRTKNCLPAANEEVLHAA